jgi:UDP-glucose:(heptosyl)LPS alpha-1,3-glucosyltransferase
MKLAFCLFKYFPYSGLSRDFLRIVSESRRRGHEVHVFASEWQGERPEGIRFTLLTTYRWMNHTQNLAFYRRLKRHLEHERFDAVIGFNKMPGLDLYYGADYCYIGRAVPRYGPLYRVTPRYHHFHTFERAVFSPESRTMVLSLSEREKSVYQEFYGTPDWRFHLLPPTLDNQRRLTESWGTVRERMRRALRVGPDELMLLFVGSGFKTKGLDRCLIALAALPEDLRRHTRLIVVGQDRTAPFERAARAYGIDGKVQFLGGRSDIPELLAAGDLLVHPAYSENTGTVLLEAIAAGLPVLTTDVCGYASHIERAAAGAVLNSPFQQRALNEKLCEMLCSAGRGQWSSNGTAYGSNPVLYRMPETAVDLIESWGRQGCRGPRPTPPGSHARLFLRPDLQQALACRTSIESIMAIRGDVFRKAPGRQTLRFKMGGRNYFLKAHTGVGWQEIVKNLAYFRLPVLGARNEWHGIHHLQRLGIDTLHIAGYGVTGRNPARRRSFIVTDELAGTISLEDYCKAWRKRSSIGGADLRFKRWLIRCVAEIARAMHASGANHRDFYLCHFLLRLGTDFRGDPQPETSRLFVIDLHRMQIRRRTPTRWAVKDVSGMFYSSMDLGLTRRDLYRFMRVYRDQPLRHCLEGEAGFWRRVRSRAMRLYVSERRRAERLAVQAVRPAASV